jgi:mannose-6-phosphate isomerase
LPIGGVYGEAWEISDHATHRSVVAEGPWSGWNLRDLLEREAEALLGPDSSGRTGQDSFPWLVKHLDACDWLSVQVHPDDESVQQLWPGEGGKTEAWFVLDAAPSSRIYAGLLPGVDEKQLRAALASGTVGDCLHQFQPRPGDCLFLPAGTVHAVGGGVLLAEVQQTSDATFRLFDWNRRDVEGRSRTLHIEEALVCIDWSRGPVQPVRASGYPAQPGQPAASGSVRQPLVSCPYFTLDYLRQAEPFTLGGSGTLQVLLVLHGRGILDSAAGSLALAPGETLLLPASLPALTCHPREPLGLLLATLPPS